MTDSSLTAPSHRPSSRLRLDVTAEDIHDTSFYFYSGTPRPVFSSELAWRLQRGLQTAGLIGLVGLRSTFLPARDAPAQDAVQIELSLEPSPSP